MPGPFAPRSPFQETGRQVHRGTPGMLYGRTTGVGPVRGEDLRAVRLIPDEGLVDFGGFQLGISSSQLIGSGSSTGQVLADFGSDSLANGAEGALTFSSSHAVVQVTGLYVFRGTFEIDCTGNTAASFATFGTTAGSSQDYAYLFRSGLEGADLIIGRFSAGPLWIEAGEPIYPVAGFVGGDDVDGTLTRADLTITPLAFA